jgi:3-oxocholest-4-en-26-oate---CoA ligase
MRGHYSDVWRAVAQAAPDRLAVITPDRRVDYATLVREAGALARHLADRGIRPGDAVAVLSYNTPEYLVALFACFASAIAPVPVNYRYRAPEVAELLRDSEARVLIAPASLASTAAEAIAAVGAPIELIVTGGGAAVPEGATSYATIVAAGGALPEAVPDGGELRLYTGGTTGRPKAVVWAADEILDVQRYAIYGALGIDAPDTVSDAVRIAVDLPRVITMPLAPFMHGTALFNAMNTLVLGGTIALVPSPSLDADAALRLVRAAGVTRLIVAGDAVCLPLLEAVDRDGGDLRPVRSVISSGMRLTVPVKRRLHALGELTIIDMLASTEGGPYAVNTTASADDLPGALRLLPGAVLLDAELREVQDEAGARGILGFRGPLPRGYWRDAEKTAQTFREAGGHRYVMPGDWAESLGDGCIELLGRDSAVINTGGEKVYAAEVEEAALAHPDVRDVVVFGIPDPRFGEVVAAVVEPRHGAELDPAAVAAQVGRTLAGYKKPRAVLVLEDLGRSPHGKVDLVALRARAAAPGAWRAP